MNLFIASNEANSFFEGLNVKNFKIDGMLLKPSCFANLPEASTLQFMAKYSYLEFNDAFQLLQNLDHARIGKFLKTITKLDFYFWNTQIEQNLYRVCPICRLWNS
jgi:hypothetical protein